ncbi:MAG: hypothetical protein RLZZ148_2541, partial [Cyanobacteriota bacterium]
KLVWSDGEWDKKYEGAELRIYYGTGGQTADPLLQSKEPSIIPYRYRAYIVVENLPLDDFSNLPPQVSATWRNGTPNLDDVLLEICLESEFLTAGDIDATELNAIPVTGFQVNQESTIAEKIQLTFSMWLMARISFTSGSSTVLRLFISLPLNWPLMKMVGSVPNCTRKTGPT